jgi:CheY-like chemotaxis protein
VLTYEQFVDALRNALHYLYDPVNLRRNPLVELLGLAGAFDQAAALQQALAAAIRALKPPDDESPQSRAWRIYDLLSLQYLRQLPRETVANQLGISERQLRREQRLAIEALAQQIYRQIAASSAAPDATTGAAASPPELRIPLGEALENVRSLAQPLAQQMSVALEIYLAAEVVDLPVSPMPLRTILLTVLTIALPLAGGGVVVMTAARRDDEIAIAVTCRATAAPLALGDKDRAALMTAQEQAVFYAAALDIAEPAPAPFVVTLRLAAPAQSLVLVIDDNADWLELVQRYAAGTRYQIVTTGAPETAGDSAGKLQPALILLDVMMHNVDGWQVLSELRHDPATAQIPVVVCTILPLAEMALALGADAFLQKPVSQQALLQMLDRQIGP